MNRSAVVTQLISKRFTIRVDLRLGQTTLKAIKYFTDEEMMGLATCIHDWVRNGKVT